MSHGTGKWTRNAELVMLPIYRARVCERTTERKELAGIYVVESPNELGLLGVVSFWEVARGVQRTRLVLLTRDVTVMVRTHRAAEQLVSLPAEARAMQQQQQQQAGTLFATQGSETDETLFARTLMSAGEFARASDVVANATDNPLAAFLHFYAAYLASEKRKEDGRGDFAGTPQRRDPSFNQPGLPFPFLFVSPTDGSLC